MIRRLLSLFLAFVTILSLLPTAAFAASSEEDALGEVDIYNGDYELGYKDPWKAAVYCCEHNCAEVKMALSEPDEPLLTND